MCWSFRDRLLAVKYVINVYILKNVKNQDPLQVQIKMWAMTRGSIIWYKKKQIYFVIFKVLGTWILSREFDQAWLIR